MSRDEVEKSIEKQISRLAFGSLEMTALNVFYKAFLVLNYVAHRHPLLLLTKQQWERTHARREKTDRKSILERAQPAPISVFDRRHEGETA
jgi:hypothetical protein